MVVHIWERQVLVPVYLHLRRISVVRTRKRMCSIDGVLRDGRGRALLVDDAVAVALVVAQHQMV